MTCDYGANTKGPPAFFSSNPSPILCCWNFDRNKSTNLSWIVSCTYRRDPAVQSWPELYKMPRATQIEAVPFLLAEYAYGEYECTNLVRGPLIQRRDVGIYRRVLRTLFSSYQLR